MKLLLNIDVPDLQRATEFYCAAFNLRFGRRLGGEVLELIGAEVPIYLLQKSEGSAPAATSINKRKYRRHWSPIHFDIVVEDIESAVARAVKAGAVQEGIIAETSWSKLALFADPFGHGFCLIEFVGRGYDEIAVASME
jgi:lactoylglutathione lyase